jgi:glycosyltransferase involved in cell wall biosynthesis
MVGPDKGDGSFEKTMEAANLLGVKDRIEFPGLVPKNDVPHWLNKGDIFLNTTNVDNTPVSVIEAMACGLCIVSTNVGGIPYLLEDGVDALLVPPEDPEAMANAVKRILTDPQLAASLSANARKKAEAFSWEKVLPMWEALFYKILGETGD